MSVGSCAQSPPWRVFFNEPDIDINYILQDLIGWVFWVFLFVARRCASGEGPTGSGCWRARTARGVDGRAGGAGLCPSHLPVQTSKWSDGEASRDGGRGTRCYLWGIGRLQRRLGSAGRQSTVSAPTLICCSVERQSRGPANLVSETHPAGMDVKFHQPIRYCWLEVFP